MVDTCPDSEGAVKQSPDARRAITIATLAQDIDRQTAEERIRRNLRVAADLDRAQATARCCVDDFGLDSIVSSPSP